MKLNRIIYNNLMYHGSPDPGITTFTPRVSTHGKQYVYANPTMSDTIIYGAKWNDFKEPVDVIDCLTINNLYDVIVKKYKIYWYPNRPDCIPDDDSDIVEHTIKIFNMNGDKSIFQKVLDLFPHLKESFEREFQQLNITL